MRRTGRLSIALMILGAGAVSFLLPRILSTHHSTRVDVAAPPSTASTRVQATIFAQLRPRIASRPGGTFGPAEALFPSGALLPAVRSRTFERSEGSVDASKRPSIESLAVVRHHTSDTASSLLRAKRSSPRPSSKETPEPAHAVAAPKRQIPKPAAAVPAPTPPTSAPPPPAPAPTSQPSPAASTSHAGGDTQPETPDRTVAGAATHASAPKICTPPTKPGCEKARVGGPDRTHGGDSGSRDRERHDHRAPDTQSPPSVTPTPTPAAPAPPPTSDSQPARGPAAIPPGNHGHNWHGPDNRAGSQQPPPPPPAQPDPPAMPPHSSPPDPGGSGNGDHRFSPGGHDWGHGR
jgi:hypothetical protein